MESDPGRITVSNSKDYIILLFGMDGYQMTAIELGMGLGLLP